MDYKLLIVCIFFGIAVAVSILIQILTHRKSNQNFRNGSSIRVKIAMLAISALLLILALYIPKMEFPILIAALAIYSVISFGFIQGKIHALPIYQKYVMISLDLAFLIYIVWIIIWLF